jgi:hypothetical protein
MSIKHKIMNVMVAHPKLVTFAIGLGITVAIGTAIGMLDHNHIAEALRNQANQNNQGSSGSGNG